VAARRRLALAVAGCAAAAAVSVPRAQDPVFRASVETVTVDVSVTRGGAPVPDLTARHFRIRDNGVPQVVERVMHDEVPLHVVLAFDTSGSLGDDGIRVLADAAGVFLDALTPQDRVGLVTFTESVDVRVPPTTQHERVRAALRDEVSRGPTAWRDALFVATQVLEPRSDARRVVLLLTDGRDTSSWLPEAEIDGVVRRSGVVLHVIEYGATPGPPGVRDAPSVFSVPGRRPATVTPRSLRAAVEAGGGRLWAGASGSGLRERFLEVLAELRSRYLVAYVPTGSAAPGWHEVSVGLVDARGDVHARPGYWMPTPR
jgi:VWFA-related protein